MFTIATISSSSWGVVHALTSPAHLFPCSLQHILSRFLIRWLTVVSFQIVYLSQNARNLPLDATVNHHSRLLIPQNNRVILWIDGRPERLQIELTKN